MHLPPDQVEIIGTKQTERVEVLLKGVRFSF